MREREGEREGEGGRERRLQLCTFYRKTIALQCKLYLCICTEERERKRGKGRRTLRE